MMIESRHLLSTCLAKVELLYHNICQLMAHHQDTVHCHLLAQACINFIKYIEKLPTPQKLCRLHKAMTYPCINCGQHLIVYWSVLFSKAKHLVRENWSLSIIGSCPMNIIKEQQKNGWDKEADTAPTINCHVYCAEGTLHGRKATKQTKAQGPKTARKGRDRQLAFTCAV